MLLKLWWFIRQLLPFFIIKSMYSSSKNHQTVQLISGRKLKLIMLTNEYGIIVSSEKYVKDRTKKLKSKYMQINKIQEMIQKEINDLSFEERERLFRENKVNE